MSSPLDVLPLLDDIKNQQREHFLCLYLNARNQVIYKEVVSIGSLSSSILHPREVFQPAVSHVAASVVFAHNHPSGDVSPSQGDTDLTRRLVQAGEIMGIDVLDHLIIGADDFLSLQDRRLLLGCFARGENYCFYAVNAYIMVDEIIGATGPFTQVHGR